MAFDGSTALIGAPEDEAVYVFSRSGSGLSSIWSQTARLTASGSEEEDEGDFGYAVSLHGTSALIGAPGDENEGRAFLFEKEQAGWTQTAVLLQGDPSPDLEFGMSMVLSTDLAVVGSPGDDDDPGAAYIFEREDSGWTPSGRLVPTVPPGEVNFGYNVAISGRSVMVNIGLDDTPVFGVYAGAIQIWVPNFNKVRRWLGPDRIPQGQRSVTARKR